MKIRKKLILFVLMLGLIFSLAACSFLEDNGLSSKPTEEYKPTGVITLQGEGTATSPYLIASQDNLNQIRNKTAYYKLTDDFKVSEWSAVQNFYGILDGDGHEIEFNANKRAIVGNNYGIIKNLQVNLYGTVAHSGGSDYIGGERDTYAAVALNNSGKILSCNIFGSVTIEGNQDFSKQYGGLVWQNASSATIEQCYTAVDVVIKGTSTKEVGGIAALNKGKIQLSASFDNISVESSSSSYAGGIAYENSGKINKCYSQSQISLLSSATLVGSVFAYAGGITYKNTGTINDSFFAGNINITGRHYTVGGLVAAGTNSIVKNCYVSAEIKADGGFLSSISTSYDPFIIGNHTVTKCFVDKNMSKNYSAQNGGVVAGDLRARTTFAGWDEETIWVTTNGLLPTLKGLKAGRNEI